MPKGVMLSHDNFIWSCKSSLDSETEDMAKGPLRIISYLPLSHAAGQFVDIHRAYITGCHIYFADPSALTGSLIQTLQ
jgi:long-chain-fatty-acid--CoA ligase ACSBG